MKQKYFIIFILIFTQFACSTTIEEKGYYDSGKLKYLIKFEQKGEQKIKQEEQKFYENGKPEYLGNFDNNTRSGTWKYWYDNGNLWTTCEYENGMKHGESFIYYKNGKIKIKGSYQNNKIAGTWVFYDETGKQIKEVNY
jgi:antitoxin component YwqK of YwqJK toxin-antitoxin module